MLVVLLAALAVAMPGETLEVPAQFATIQAAIDAADPGDELLVSPGTYVENIDFLGKDIVVRSAEGPEGTIIDGGGTAHVVKFDSGETPAAELDGFTITNGCACTGGAPSPNGGGILVRGGSPTVRRCLVIGNSADIGSGGWGGGIGVLSQGLGDARPSFIQCTVAANSAELQGGGIWVNGTGGVVHPTFDSCIVWGNSPNAVEVGFGGSISFTYSDVQGGAPGQGNISANPQFVGAGDYSLQATSPCIDAGNPALGPDCDGSQADMGSILEPCAWENLANALPGSTAPELVGVGSLAPGTAVTLSLTNAPPFALAYLVIGVSPLNASFKSGVLVPSVDILLPVAVNGFGEIEFAFPWPSGVPGGVSTWYQYWIADTGAYADFSASNALKATTP